MFQGREVWLYTNIELPLVRGGRNRIERKEKWPKTAGRRDKSG